MIEVVFSVRKPFKTEEKVELHSYFDHLANSITFPDNLHMKVICDRHSVIDVVWQGRGMNAEVRGLSA
jgi:thymidylate kinase